MSKYLQGSISMPVRRTRKEASQDMVGLRVIIGSGALMYVIRTKN